MSGVDMILAERLRQINEEGFQPKHDVEYHTHGELVMAAIAYLFPEGMVNRKAYWPWGDGTWKPTPKDRLKELKKAGALIAAEMDRLIMIEELNGRYPDPSRPDPNLAFGSSKSMPSLAPIKNDASPDDKEPDAPVSAKVIPFSKRH